MKRRRGTAQGSRYSSSESGWPMEGRWTWRCRRYRHLSRRAPGGRTVNNNGQGSMRLWPEPAPETESERALPSLHKSASVRARGRARQLETSANVSDWKAVHACRFRNRRQVSK